jgi:hypothetical protein
VWLKTWLQPIFNLKDYLSMDIATHNSHVSKLLPTVAWGRTSIGGHFQRTYHLMTCVGDGHFSKRWMVWEIVRPTVAVVFYEIAKHKPRYSFHISALSLRIKSIWNTFIVARCISMIQSLFYTNLCTYIYYQSLKHFVHLIAPTCFDTQRVIIRELYFPG